MDDTCDIKRLSERTGVSVRTIRYYLAENLLPPPQGRGVAAVYDTGHRNRLLLIRRLQDAHQPLAAIRRQLEALDDAGVAAALAEPLAPTPAAQVADAASASDYVRKVLAATRAGRAPQRARDGATAVAPSSAAPGPAELARSTWERIILHPDLELHVRRPLARADQRRLEALLAEAERLFGRDPL
jgi:DNA-binding transcriptional MerR regulator